MNRSKFCQIENQPSSGCGSLEHFSRRSLLKLAGLSGLSWLTPTATRLARQDESNRAGQAKSLIVLWLEGAPAN